MSNRRRRDARGRKVKSPTFGNFDVRCFTRAKFGEKTNADAFNFDLDRGRFIIADGVSRSFRPHLWSNHICHSLVQNQKKVTKRTLGILAQNFLHEERPLPWNLEELRDRGSHSTVLVLNLRRRRSCMVAEVVSIGDCIFASISQNRKTIKGIWPFKNMGEMPFATSAISSVRPFLMGAEILKARIQLKPGTRILIMTDAMARYLIGSSLSLDLVFPFLSGDVLFEDWADKMRSAELIENDDLTLLEISFDPDPIQSRSGVHG